MIKIVTSREMREMDQFSISKIGIPGAVLMENAGRQTFQIILDILGETENPLVYIFCGKGNNGGDGFVIARYLQNAGVTVRIWVVGSETDIQGDSRINYNILSRLDFDIHFLTQKPDLKKIVKVMPDLAVDALLGTGISGAVHGLIKEVIELLNTLSCPVVSVDIPSGLSADSPVVSGAAVAADVTVTMALPKRCHLFYPARQFVGKLFVADIGIPASITNSSAVFLQAVEKSDIHLPERQPDIHKYQCGKVAVLAGSPGYTGAAALTSQAAMRSGAGLVILGIPAELNSILEIKLTEVITRPYGKSRLDSAADPAVEELLQWCDVLAIGPGLGRTENTRSAVLNILMKFEKPVVIDADALYAISVSPEILRKPRPHWILTPHHGEFLRMIPETTKEKLQAEIVDLARKFVMRHQLVLLLKGAPSLVASPDGQVYVNTTGNSGLASGGTGDVLTGMVAGFRAQGLDPVQSAMTANYLHGLCADQVISGKSPHSLLAGDLLENLGSVMKKHFSAETSGE